MRRIKASGWVVIGSLLVVVACISALSGCSCNQGETTHEIYPTSRFTDQPNFPKNQESLKMPLYTSKVVSNSIKGSYEETDGKLAKVNLNYETGDDYDAVVAWYTDKLGEPTSSETNEYGEKTTVWESKDGDYTDKVWLHQGKLAPDTIIDVSRSLY